MGWRLVLALAAALAARPDPRRDHGADPASVRPGGAVRVLAPAALETAPHNVPDRGAAPTVDPPKRPHHWAW
jgi:hypothetical protein